MRKAPLLLSLIVPVLVTVVFLVGAPKSNGLGEPPLPSAYQPNVGWMNFKVTPRPNPAGLDFVVSTEIWCGAANRRFDTEPAVLRVAIFAPGDEDGKGEPLFWWQSDPFSAVKGRRITRNFPFFVPVPNARSYPARIAIQTFDPKARTDKHKERTVDHRDHYAANFMFKVK